MPNFTKRLEGYLSKLKTKSVVKPNSTTKTQVQLGQSLNPANTKKFSDQRRRPIAGQFPVSPGYRKPAENPHAMPGASKSSELYNRKKARAFSLLFDSLQ